MNRASSLPTGTVTFLFTDIEGFTRMLQQQGEGYRDVQEAHFAIMREAIALGGGHEVSTEGDAFFVAFLNPAGAVEAAVAAQRKLFAWQGPDGVSLRIRMGLHTGQGTVSGGTYLSMDVNRAARIGAAAHGGQVLMADSTRGLVEHALPEGVSLRDLGFHGLKDLPHPEKLHQLVIDGLPSDFPPVNSLGTRPNNLPLQLTSFVGREREMAEANRLLSQSRLLTVTGPGGTGKTRLSLQVAADLLDAFEDGVWLVELAPLSDPALVPQAVATALHVREQPGRALADTLTDHLRAKSLLLILDNCEHVIDASAQLVRVLLTSSPGLKVLTSSREALGVAGETAYRLASLSLPGVSEPLLVDNVLESEAARLFVERAQATQPSFAVTEQNLAALVQVLQRLDGIPLALELAAARVRLLTVEQIASRLDDRFRLLTGGSRSALPRQQTLGALIDWSYDLLPEAERTALNQLSVFAGGWTFEAAEAVIGTDTLDLLARLVDKSLVVSEEENGEVRCRLLETIRQYARDKLLDSGQAAEARDLHLAYVLQLVEEAEPKLEGSEMVPWLDRLATEHDNIRSALEWGLDRDPEAALRLVSGLTSFWQRRGFLTEGRRMLSQSLARVDALPPADGDARRARMALRAKALWCGGTNAFGQGELDVARAMLDEAVVLAREYGTPKTLVDALAMLGFAFVLLGDEAASEAVIEEGETVASATKYKQGIVALNGVRGEFARRFQNDFAAVIARAEEGVRLVREIGNPWFLAINIFGLGVGTSLQGESAEAEAMYKESEALFRDVGDLHMANAVKSERAHVERRRGNYAPALDLYRETIKSWREFGQSAALAHELECIAFIAVAESQPDRAARLLGAAESIREDVSAAMTAFEQPEYEAAVAALKTQLDDHAYTSAWADGRTLTIDQALEIALR
jgi:predicted ATPase/class 3 adenylate cyclase